VPASVAQALGIQDSGSEPLRLILADVLGDGPALLILDNFEQVSTPPTWSPNLLQRCLSWPSW